jgi:hypothetical protein
MSSFLLLEAHTHTVTRLKADTANNLGDVFCRVATPLRAPVPRANSKRLNTTRRKRSASGFQSLCCPGCLDCCEWLAPKTTHRFRLKSATVLPVLSVKQVSASFSCATDTDQKNEGTAPPQ